MRSASGGAGMPRARAFTRSDVSDREQVALDLDLIKKIERILEDAHIKPPKLTRVACEFEQAIRTYRLRICADNQESSRTYRCGIETRTAVGKRTATTMA
jgi:hypothetical protein